MGPHTILKQYFGYESFRPGQLDIIRAILEKRDVLAIMPTSAGKSICYQIPALLQSGISLVISPLIALMHNQVTQLQANGIQALYLNSSLSEAEFKAALTQIKQDKVRLIYVAPERLSQKAFVSFMQDLPIQLIAVDEAHCISQWGHDFRPAYQQIAVFINHLKKRPVIAAFTATATHQVRQDIIHYLNLQAPFKYLSSFDRPNLYYTVVEPADKDKYLLSLLKEETVAIIYCATRKKVDQITAFLNQAGFQALGYHAGMSLEQRHTHQHAFQFDQVNIMVATNAFGMGIDKPNIRQVIHYNMPKDMESYYQEAGRAGRDGEAAKCTLLFASQDIMTNLWFVAQSQDPIAHQKLNAMIGYCQTSGCLRSYILAYFGEALNHTCYGCSHCSEKIEMVDITLQAQQILSCLYRINEAYGLTKLVEILKGKRSLSQFRQLTTYGIMSDLTQAEIKRMIGLLVADQYIMIQGKDYPILKLTEKAKSVLLGQQKVTMKASLRQQLTGQAMLKSRGNETQVAYDEALFDLLRQLRLELAHQYQLPPFMIFSDTTLKALCRHYPTTPATFLQISGVGIKKLEKYGHHFISCIQAYLNQKNLS